MLLVVLARVAWADLAPPPGQVVPSCDSARCGEVEARECVTSLGQAPDCAWIAEGWERVCLRKAGTRAVHVMCRTAAPPATGPAPSDPPEPRRCGCDSAGSPSTLAAAGVLLLLLRRR